MPVNRGDGRESHDTQRARAMRALDVVAAKTIQDSSEDNPKTVVPYGLIIEDADVNRATLNNEGYVWHVHRHSGARYQRNKGEFKLKCRDYLGHRKKLNRIEKIAENPKDHIFTEGGVKPE